MLDPGSRLGPLGRSASIIPQKRKDFDMCDHGPQHHAPHQISSHQNRPAEIKGDDGTHVDETPIKHEMTTDVGHGLQPMVSVLWKDAESQGGPGWEDTEEMFEFARRPLITVHTVGILIHADEAQIAITDTITSDQMGGVTKIPRGWIEKIQYLHPSGDFETQLPPTSNPDSEPRNTDLPRQVG